MFQRGSYKMATRYVFTILTILLAIEAFSNGLPEITNYSRSEYNAGTQNWAFTQSENGLVYFANNNGLLEFDGESWRLYERDPSFIHRAALAKEERVYIGGRNEFGYYTTDSTGNLSYHSLISKLPDEIDRFDEIWKIHDTHYGVVFQSFQYLFVYDGDSIKVVHPVSQFHFSYYVNNVLWVYDEEGGLMRYNNGKLQTVPNGKFFSGLQVWGILPFGENKVLLGTVNKGLFIYDGKNFEPWDTPVSAFLKRNQLYSSLQLDEDTYVFGSIQNGLVGADKNGAITLHINKQRGLQNNTVLSIGKGKDDNLWLGLDNGISRISINSPLSYIQDYFDIGAGYTSSVYKNSLYFGTNQGVYQMTLNEFQNPLKTTQSIRLVKGTEGQAWNLSVVYGDLLCGHHSGVFQITENGSKQISDVNGAWTFLPLGEGQPVLVGHYTGISKLKKQNGQWHYDGELKGFDISSRFLEKDNSGHIWIGHGYYGIYKLTLNEKKDSVLSVVLYNHENGLKSDFNNNVFKVDSKILVTTDNGIYEYDETADKLIYSEYYNSLFSHPDEVYFLEQIGNNIWFYENSRPGVIRKQEDGRNIEITAPFKEIRNSSVVTFEHITRLSGNKVILGTENGFAIYNPSILRDYDKKFPVLLKDIRFQDTTLAIYRISSTYKEGLITWPEVKFRFNTVQFGFAAESYKNDQIEYSYRLLGFTEEWSPWDGKSSKEFTNLADGEYTMELRARNVYGTESDTVRFGFTILPPFYKSLPAYFMYLAGMVLLILFIRYRYRLSLEKSREKEKQKQKALFKEKEHELMEKTLIAEKEMVRLRNEKLRSEMVFKEKELANSTMHIIQKNKFLNKIKLEILNIGNNVQDSGMKNRISSIVRKIDKDIDNEKQWEIFEMHLDQVHEDFLKRIKLKHPDLSPRELKLCAYLRMNMSSKEIASLMNITPRGVEIHRYRIRQKLKLQRSDNLTEYIIKI